MPSVEVRRKSVYAQVHRAEESEAPLRIAASRATSYTPPSLLPLIRRPEVRGDISSAPSEIRALWEKFSEEGFIEVEGVRKRVDEIKVWHRNGIVSGYNIYEVEKKGEVSSWAISERDDRTVLKYRVESGYSVVLAETFDKNILHIIYG